MTSSDIYTMTKGEPADLEGITHMSVGAYEDPDAHLGRSQHIEQWLRMADAVATLSP